MTSSSITPLEAVAILQASERRGRELMCGVPGSHGELINDFDPFAFSSAYGCLDFGGRVTSPMTNVHSSEGMEVNMEDTCGLTQHGL